MPEFGAAVGHRPAGPKEHHVHKAAHVSVLDGGVTYEVCDCGAVRVTRRGKAEPWHACDSCVQGAMGVMPGGG